MEVTATLFQTCRGGAWRTVRPGLCSRFSRWLEPFQWGFNDKRMVFRTWWAAGSWGPGESWPQILCRPLRLDSRRRSPEGAGLSGSSLRWVLDKHPTVAWNFVSAAGSDWAGYLVEVLCRTCARDHG